MAPDQREQLLQWIERSRRTQRRLGIVLAACAAVSVALMVWRKEVGGIALAITIATGIAGFWITGAHVIEFRTRLADLDRPKVRRVAGGGRRW